MGSLDVFLWCVLYVNSSEKPKLFQHMLESAIEKGIEHFLIMVVFSESIKTEEKIDIIEKLHITKELLENDKGIDFYIIEPNITNLKNRIYYIPNEDYNLFDCYEKMMNFVNNGLPTKESIIEISPVQPIMFMRDVDFFLPVPLNIDNSFIINKIPENLILIGEQYVLNDGIEQELIDFENKKVYTKNNFTRIVDLSGFIVPYGVIIEYYKTRDQYYSKYEKYPDINKKDIKYLEKVRFIDFIQNHFGILPIIHSEEPFIFHRLGKYNYDI